LPNIVGTLSGLSAWNQAFAQVLEKLDPNHHAQYRLFADATVVGSGGTNVKDLSLLNRPLDKVRLSLPAGCSSP